MPVIIGTIFRGGRVYKRALQEVVLLHVEDQPVCFARVEKITPDHKPGWYHIKLLLLQLPYQVLTWILRDAYIDGAEFTMGGKRMRLENVICPEDETPEAPVKDPKPRAAVSDGPPVPASNATVINFADRKKP